MFFKKSLIFCLCLLAGVLSAQTTVLTADAGPNKKICLGNSDTIGGAPTAKGGTSPYTYSWTPANSLNLANVANPIASPTVTTVYTVTVTDSNSPDAKTTTSTVKITVLSYTVNAGRDTTIKEGQTISLHGYAPGDSLVYWGIDSLGSNNILNQTTLNPDVFPTNTTVYTLFVLFPGGCSIFDQVTVTVIPDGQLYFFNSFSPNGDLVNDYFVIGNIDQYPNNTFEVYNRYGQKVFSKTGYNNDWNGSYLGNELPCGTYFYILDTHDTKAGKYHGEINIIK
ncbi:MAG: gliding motility-associated C-terminal domain-containing protein [Bacteroidia bacterium]